MAPSMSFLVLLTATPLLVGLVHACLVRLVRLFKLPYQGQVVALLSGLLGMPIMMALLWPLGPVAFLYAFFTYAGLAYAYFHLYNLSETARRVHILRELDNRGALSEKELGKLYTAERMLPVRMERLLGTKQIRLEGDRYFLTTRGLLRAGMFLRDCGKGLGYAMEIR